MLSELALLIRSNGYAAMLINWPDHMSFLSFVGYFMLMESFNGTMGKMATHANKLILVALRLGLYRSV